MSNDKKLLCKNLSLSIWFEPAPTSGELIKLRLVDKVALKKVEMTIEVSKMIAYHIQEAVVIGMRRLVSDAVKQGLISVSPGPSVKSAQSTQAGGVTGITLSIPPDL